MPKLRVNMVVVLPLLVVALVLMVGCASDEVKAPDTTSTSSPDPEAEATGGELAEEPTAEIPAVAEDEPGVSEEIESQEPAKESTLVPTAEPTSEPTATPVIVVDVDSACVECHTNADLLKSLADEPEVASLSTGEG